MWRKFIAGYFAAMLGALVAGCAPVAPDKVLVLTESPSYGAMLNQSSTEALLSTEDNGVELWQLSPKTLKHRWQHGAAGNESVELALSQNGEFAASLSRDSVALWRTADGAQVGWWSLPEPGQSIAVANQGSLLIALVDGSVMSLVGGQQKLIRFLGHSEKVNSVALSADGRLALSGGNDYRAILWQASTGQPISEQQFGARVLKVALSADGSQAFAADAKADARIFATDSGKEVSRLRIKQRSLTFSSARFSGDNQLLLTGTPFREVMRWQVSDGKLLTRWQAGLSTRPQIKGAVVYSVATSDDPGVAAVSISSSGKVEYWPQR
ncbi:WD40 repeat domain-containing protein [Shewanella sp. JM162201]|uniref:WD40 repeat domain-containing protein n=1 Tax=Shewanella jiangmenensis TaxID=2837387 RepID=A0ABS5V1E8_9GAMM|nr:WD40 repeat domain-containing protein [Shewanella jiangmenensis]MBT1444297.1 WD40 repeat domain-containing protein [Shewanella jiangmenensis]